MCLGQLVLFRKRCRSSLWPDSRRAGVNVALSVRLRELWNEVRGFADGGTTLVDNPLLTASYDRLLARGVLLPDPAQAIAVRALQLLQDAVVQREARRVVGLPAAPPPSADQQHQDQKQKPAAAGSAVRGAYLWGPVGSGKTAVMDLFAETTRQRLAALLPPPPLPPPPGAAAASATATSAATAAGASEAAVRAAPIPGSVLPRFAARHHFHEFMQGVHGRLHELQLALPRVVARSRQGMLVYRYAEPEEDPLLTVAREWGSRTAVLCLDELHVTDVADAMILARLFSALLVDFSTAVVFTSNRPPQDLYKGGLSRKFFEPFVRLVDEQMVVLRVAAEVDYRRASAATTTTRTTAGAAAEAAQGDLAVGRWYVGAEGAAERLHSLWRGRQEAPAADNGCGGGGGSGSVAAAAAAGPVEVPLAYGRTLKVPCAAGDAAWFTFEQLCGATGLRAAVDDGGALAAPDFLALSRRFRELYITAVPQLGPAQRDEARRLVTLLDVAYDNRCRLLVSAEVPPDELFAPLLAEARRQGVNPTLGLSKFSRNVLVQVGDSGGGGGGSAMTSSSSPPTDSSSSAADPVVVPAASVTAALHMRLGPSVTHGSALSNSIHPSEFTGTAAADAFAVPPQMPPQHVTAQHHAHHHHSQQQRPAEGQQQQQQQPELPTAVSAPQQQPLAPGASGATQSSPKPGDLTVPHAVLAEEVLMYHRASSRLAEMCRVVCMGPRAGEE